LVSVVTLFFVFLYETVSAVRDPAVRGTRVGVIVIAVIAGFDVQPNKPVTATSRLAGIEATVVIAQITVVTLLLPFLYESVSAPGFDAGIQARVFVVQIAVIAGFSLLQDTISAFR
jgi:hypothetical protein